MAMTFNACALRADLTDCVGIGGYHLWNLWTKTSFTVFVPIDSTHERCALTPIQGTYFFFFILAGARYLILKD